MAKVIAKANERAAEDPATKRWARKLHSSRLMFLREDPDFLTMIKIGRVMNALNFCITTVSTFRDYDNLTHRRQGKRAYFLLGGYVHQAIVLVDSIKGRYLGNEAFEPLRFLVLDYEYRNIRKFAKKMRNYTAFHLDEYDETTRRTLSKLKPTMYTLMCGEDQMLASHYFSFSDFLDMTFLGNEFWEGHDEVDQIVNGAISELFTYSTDFLIACDTFQQWLWKTKIQEHVY
jgi:hypothetical protein